MNMGLNIVRKINKSQYVTKIKKIVLKKNIDIQNYN